MKVDAKNGFISENYLTNFSAYNSVPLNDKDLFSEEAKDSTKVAKEQRTNEVGKVFNMASFLKSLRNSLENTLSYYDKLLYKEFKKIEVKKKGLTGSLQDLNAGYESSTINMSENLTNIRRSIIRKRKLLDEDIECRSQSVGRQWSESLKYSRVENKKTLREIRIAAELRDVIASSFDSVIKKLLDEMQNPSSKYVSTNELIYSARRLVNFEYFSNGTSQIRASSMSDMSTAFRYNYKKTSVESLMSNSMMRISAVENKNSTISVSDKKKTKNLNEFILKKSG